MKIRDIFEGMVSRQLSALPADYHPLIVSLMVSVWDAAVGTCEDLIDRDLVAYQSTSGDNNRIIIELQCLLKDIRSRRADS